MCDVTETCKIVVESKEYQNLHFIKKLEKIRLAHSFFITPAEKLLSTMIQIMSSTRNSLSQHRLNWLQVIISSSDEDIKDVDVELISEVWQGEPHRFWNLKSEILYGYKNEIDGSDSDQSSSEEDSDSSEVEKDEEDDMSDSVQGYDQYIESSMQKDSEQWMKPE
ncbi:MAG: hypothetical protein EZS28_052683 [Streblomastix strix]|uniref:Uncharacterized protein n=1 Tax=Streblomastix strix TaxID=222440 RepID=A0A5J4RZS4_9EUKA|nr:MAG: hypothetical protein EZS28_052683 [Streblomastix strix]